MDNLTREDMDVKDLEILAHLHRDGRYSFETISSLVGITPGNVDRRIRLMIREGIIDRFSGFIDRRIFNYDTTYVRLSFDMKNRGRIQKAIGEMVQVASIITNLDDFMLCEIVHYDRAALMSALRAMERIASPHSVTAHYVPRFRENIPEVPSIDELNLMIALVDDGRASETELSERTDIEEDRIAPMIEKLVHQNVLHVLPLVNEGEIDPFPPISAIVSVKKSAGTEKNLASLLNIAKECYFTQVLQEPRGVWIRHFGKDLHAMDDLLERMRRSDGVLDVSVLLPDEIFYKREVDRNILLHGIEGIS
ncbi:MAG: Lrp/AsnC family transcriptional regulator [Thermoplasmata archaeon]|nr:Lrp/AsnC family transcriptional regulator [Thermoplasmata archaeon]